MVRSHLRERVQATSGEKTIGPCTMELIDYIRLAFFVFIAVCLVILAMNPTQEDEEDYENWIDYHDTDARARRDRDGRSPKDSG